MTMLHLRLHAAFALIVNLSLSPDAAATVLAVFDFDQPGGGFENTAHETHFAVADAVFSDLEDTLTHYSGVQGRALGARGFTRGNRITLAIRAMPGFRLRPTVLRFDGRRSATGPRSLDIALDGLLLGSVDLDGSFSSLAIEAAGRAWQNSALFSFSGAGARSAAGTLRLDNVRLEGGVRRIPEPAPWSLMMVALGALWLAHTKHRQGRS